MNLPSWLLRPPEPWQRGTLDRERLAEAARALCAREEFPERCRLYAAKMLEIYRSSSVLNLVMREHARFAFVAFSLHLHHRRGGGELGLTYTRLCELFEAGQHTRAGKLATPTRIKAMLGLARLLGHVVPVAAKAENADRRRKLLEPTAKLASPAADWLRAGLEAVAPWGELVAPPDVMMAAPDLLAEVLSYNVGAYIHDRFTLHEPFPAVRAMMARENGYVTLMRLLRGLDREGSVWLTSAPSIEIAKQHRSSPGTVRNVLAMGEGRGWLKRLRPGGRLIELTDAFAKECQTWVAYETVWTTGLANAALERRRTAKAL